MTTYPLSVQLYSLREEIASWGMPKVLERVAEIGYAAVEPAGLGAMEAGEFRQRVEALGMKVSSFHQPWANPDNLDQVKATSQAFGLDIACSGYGRDRFRTAGDIDALADEINRMCAELGKDGLRLFVHNHWWEFVRLNGAVKHALLAEKCPDLLFEIDTYWASNFGAEDAAQLLEETFAARAPLLHIKDGMLVPGQANLACGDGRMDLPAVVAAADPKVLRYLVVELDRCDGDMFTAVADSFAYLTKAGLGHGR